MNFKFVKPKIVIRNKVNYPTNESKRHCLDFKKKKRIKCSYLSTVFSLPIKDTFYTIEMFVTLNIFKI